MEAQEKPDVLSHEIKGMSEKEVLKKMSDMRKTLLTLEWDKNHNQIHMGMEEKYNKMKQEYDALEAHLNTLKTLGKQEEKEVEAGEKEELV
jgi:hypothetical protein